MKPRHADPNATPDRPAADASERPRRGVRLHARPRHGRTVGAVIGLSLAVLALVTAGITTAAWRHLDRNLEELAPVAGPRPDNVDLGEDGEPLDILVMGSDSRDCRGCGIDDHTGEGQRSDTTVLLHVAADRSRAYAVSIPRDMIIDRPACTSADGTTEPAATDVQWNAAFDVGGPTCTVQQVEAMTGIRLEHYLVVDFGGLRRMVAALGGVEMCIPHDIVDPKHGIMLKAGTRRLSPTESEDYLRERYELSYGTDTGRMKRQQAFMAAMIHDAVSAGMLAHPTRLYHFLDAVTASVRLDPDLDGLHDLVAMARDLGRVGTDRIRFLTMPSHEDPDVYGRILPTQPAANRLWNLLVHDRTLPARLAQGSISADAVPGSGRKDRGPGAATADELEFAGLCT